MADEVAKTLDKKLRDSLRDQRATMFTESGMGFHRPLLIILDRNVDLSAPLMHNIHYQSLCHDVLNMNLNYINLKEKLASPAGQPERTRIKTVDCSRDQFWLEHRTLNFFQVAEAVQKKVNSWQEEMDKIKKMKAEMGLEDSAGGIDVENSNKVLGNAIASIPEKLKQKESLDTNMSIATNIATEVSARGLDNLYTLEDSLNVKDQTPLQVIKSDKGTIEDKTRYLLYLILRDVIKVAEIDSLKEELAKQPEGGKYLAAINYIKSIKSRSTTIAQGFDQNNNENQAQKMFSKFLNTSAAIVNEGMKQLSGKRLLPVTRLVDQIIEQKDTGDIQIGYWDPKLSNANTLARSKAPVTEVIVFMVGGGSYNEYLDVCKNERKAINERRVTYGCTDVINSEHFLHELQILGSED